MSAQRALAIAADAFGRDDCRLLGGEPYGYDDIACLGLQRLLLAKGDEALLDVGRVCWLIGWYSVLFAGTGQFRALCVRSGSCAVVSFRESDIS